MFPYLENLCVNIEHIDIAVIYFLNFLCIFHNNFIYTLRPQKWYTIAQQRASKNHIWTQAVLAPLKKLKQTKIYVFFTMAMRMFSECMKHFCINLRYYDSNCYIFFNLVHKQEQMSCWSRNAVFVKYDIRSALTCTKILRVLSTFKLTFWVDTL
jgi:hypothetical protein